MGEKNDVLCAFLEKPAVFADFVDGCLFKGKKGIRPEELSEGSKEYHVKYEASGGKLRNAERTRDVVKKLCRGRAYAVLAVENQDELHYAMPFRCMEYDVADYARQLKGIRDRHKEKNDLKSGAEYLSGMKEEDKLNPVITIVFYHGKGKWDTCRELHDMLNFEGENESFKAYTANYRMNLVTLPDMEETCFKTGLRELVGMMKRSEDKEKMKEYCRENEERFRYMDEETFETVSVMTGCEKLLGYKRENPERRGTVDMCRALDEMMEESRMEGENAFAVLVGKLLADGRMSEVELIVTDESRRRELFLEYGLQNLGKETIMKEGRRSD